MIHSNQFIGRRARVKPLRKKATYGRNSLAKTLMAISIGWDVKIIC